MNPLVSAQQASFFRSSGYIEFESLLSSSECDEIQQHIDGALLARCKRNLSWVGSEELYSKGRDLWRSEDLLKTRLLSKRFTNLVFGLTNKPSLCLGFDQWMCPMAWGKSIKTKDLFSIQGLACIYFIRLNEPKEDEISPETFQMEPGLIPLPRQKGHLLAVQPNLLLNLPKLSLYQTGLYCVGYAFSNAVYFHNPQDPCNSELKAFGYQFGDRLTAAHHPIVRS